MGGEVGDLSVSGEMEMEGLEESLVLMDAVLLFFGRWVSSLFSFIRMLLRIGALSSPFSDDDFERVLCDGLPLSALPFCVDLSRSSSDSDVKADDDDDAEGDLLSGGDCCFRRRERFP